MIVSRGQVIQFLNLIDQVKKLNHSKMQYVRFEITNIKDEYGLIEFLYFSKILEIIFHSKVRGIKIGTFTFHIHYFNIWLRAYNAEAVLQIDMLLGIIAGFDICQKLLIFLTFSLVYKTIRQSQWAYKEGARPVGEAGGQGWRFPIHYVLWEQCLSLYVLK